MASDDDKRTGIDAHGATAISSPDLRTTRTPKPDLFLGSVIADRYRVIEVLGRGGMGCVYVGEHIQLKKRVALKVLSESLAEQPDLVERFLKEARAAALIGHANIVDVFDLGELPEGGAFIAMELLEGCDLDVMIDRDGAIPVERASYIVAEICRALAAAHGKGIVHRDMKPANVFLARDSDGGEHIKVLDFGIAQITASAEDSRLTQTGAIVGTPAFMSPEQGRGERPDHRTDVYSVGAIFYTLVTGDVPFDAGSLMGVITKHLFDPLEPPSTRRADLLLSPEVDAFVARAMAKKPADRFQTMKEMWTALEALGGVAASWPDASSGSFRAPAPRDPTPTPTPAASESVILPPRSRGPLYATLGILLAASIGVVVLLAKPKPAVVPPAPVPVVSENVSIDVRTTPIGAMVLFDDDVLGKTPLHLVRKRSDETRLVTLTSDGYRDEKVQIDFDRDHVYNVAMKPDVHPATTPQPAEGPTSKPSREPKDPKIPRAKTQHAATAGKDGLLKDPFHP